MTMRATKVAVLPLIAIFAACDMSGRGNVAAPLDPDSQEGPTFFFDLDTSNDVGSAYEISPEAMDAGTVFEETIYPRFDDDFWHIPIATGGQIVSVNLLYNKGVSPIQLAIDWIGPSRLCVPTPVVTCSSQTDCGTGGLCDQARGKGTCRAANAVACASDADCGTGEACLVGIEDQLITVIEPGGTAQHRVKTIVAAHIAGDYYLRVYDRGNLEEDDETRYRLKVAAVVDPDVQEMNDARTMASPLANGTAITGFFSFKSDVDWYRIDPAADAGAATAPIVEIDLTWPDGVSAIPTWVLVQNDAELVTARMPAITGTGKQLSATFVLPAMDTVYLRVENTNGMLDTELGYDLNVTITQDSDEAGSRNDRAKVATPLDATSFGTLHGPVQHTIVAENDVDWYRVDRSSTNETGLLYIHASSSSSNFMLQVLVFEQTGDSCDPNTTDVCSSGAYCVCPFSGTCSSSQGECLRSWVQRPVPNDPAGDPQVGGRTPNNIETQLPIFDSGSGALYVQVGHLTQVFPPRAGFSRTDTYTLEMIYKQDPDVHDRSAKRNEFYPLPFGANEGTFLRSRRPQYVGGVGSSVTSYLSYDTDQDWFAFDASGVPEGMARLILTQGGTPLDLRFQVRRGGSKVGDGDRRDNGWSSAVSGQVVLDPSNECSHMTSTSNTIYVWVNDVDFNDFDEQTPYTIRLEMRDGCHDPPCHRCRCSPTACGCPQQPSCGCPGQPACQNP